MMAPAKQGASANTLICLWPRAMCPSRAHFPPANPPNLASYQMQKPIKFLMDTYNVHSLRFRSCDLALEVNESACWSSPQQRRTGFYHQPLAAALRQLGSYNTGPFSSHLHMYHRNPCLSAQLPPSISRLVQSHVREQASYNCSHFLVYLESGCCNFLN